MNEQSIQKQYNQIVSFLEEKRLKEAIFQLDAFLHNSNDWTLRNRLEQIQTSYRYMLQYMRLGMKDPERQKLYRQLVADTWEIADQTRLILLDEVSTHYYHSLRRNPNQLPKVSDISGLQKILEGFTDEMAVSQLANYQGLDAILKRHEETHQVMFLMTWSNSSWTVEEAVQAQNMLRSETLAVNDLCLFVSAVTLSLMECFDERKVNWLLDGLQHTNPHVNQRALVGLVFILHLYPSRVLLYPELEARISLYGEDPNFTKQLNRVYIQLLRSQETEKIDKKMREEIIPEMMRNVNIMRNMKFGFEETDENDRNPDWEQAFEQSGLGDKIREMNELQLEGADVYMSTFAQLKGYPFFRELHNWFYPFDQMHSSIIHLIGLNPANDKSVFSIILQSGFFCNSDKYSFCFTIAQLPQGQRDMMLSQMTPPDQTDFMEEKNSAGLKQYAVRPEAISNQYIHDLYRFFKLNQHRFEFHNIFQEEIALHRNPVLKRMLNDPELLTAVADFLFHKEHPVEALEIYRILIDRKQANADVFQKTGFCFQKEKRYQEAVDAYQKADMLKPDHLWTLRHLATCYRQMKDIDSALEYYHRVEAIQPENRNVLFYTGSCLAEEGRYEEALQYFFKLDFLENDSIKAWRGIGWCSYVSGKYEQAMKYYDRILAGKPLSTDYLNAGHVAWTLGNLGKAAGLYSKAAAESGSRNAFMEMFARDRNSILKQGINEEDIPLMLDMID
ncbi:tetratricopeptide repeat protein [Bacteroides sp. UBA939]|uniref:tetratricopeptide repeat protein n=1 Tax=Bacteroides sp. UBA939 TaxID=1946092 RepID=UPI0025B855A1|nr:tetratricopeptide repeat protein [Bacteroides sp. UBA939]